MELQRRKKPNMTSRAWRDHIPLSRTLKNMAAKVLHERAHAKADNSRGAGRYANRKLTADQVRDLRRRYALGEPVAALAQESGLKKDSLRAVLNGISYAWVI